MNTLFGMMNTASSGLRTSQAGINVTANNMANVGNANFSRQRISFGAARPLNGVGTGVTIQQIHRIRDQHLDVQIRNETSSLRDLEVQRDFLTQLEEIINEPSDTGLNQMMSDMWDAWDRLSANPNDPTLQMLVQESTRAVADQLSHFNNQFNNTITDINNRQDAEITNAEGVINQINEINRQIEAFNGNVPDTLLDQRDALLGQLSEFMPVDVTINSNNTVSVTSATSEGQVDVLGLDGDGIRDIVPNLTGGTLHGFEAARESVENLQGQINEFAQGLAEAFNNVQAQNGGEPIFEINPDGSIAINEGVEIVAADEMLALRETPINIGGQEVRLDHFYQGLVSNLGVQGQRLDSQIATQENLVNHLNERFDMNSGVNLDEEMVNLIQFQAAFDASAQVMSTITDMIDTIIHRLGA